MKNIAKAILNVMNEVKGIEKSMTVGSGANAYKGVPDQVVKIVIGEAMAKNGLCILPTKVTPKTTIDRWEHTDNYGTKMKQNITTEVTTEYLLLHDSGESIQLSGYGHGMDSQDKGAGKATTYALKYVLLYTFLVPTGKIDDADVHHSDSIATPAKVEKPKPAFTIEKFQAAFDKGFDIAKIKETHYVAADIEAKYLLFSKAAK